METSAIFLQSLPEVNLLSILRKLNYVSFHRLRQTTKWLEDFVEEHGITMNIAPSELCLRYADSFQRHFIPYLPGRAVFKERNWIRAGRPTILGGSRTELLIRTEQGGGEPIYSKLPILDSEVAGICYKGLLHLENVTFTSTHRSIAIFKSIKCDGVFFRKVSDEQIESILQEIQPKTIKINSFCDVYKKPLYLYGEEILQLPALRTASYLSIDTIGRLVTSFFSEEQEQVCLTMDHAELTSQMLRNFFYDMAVPSKRIFVRHRLLNPVETLINRVLKDVPYTLEWSQEIHSYTPINDVDLEKLINDRKGVFDKVKLYSITLPNQKILAIVHRGNSVVLRMRRFETVEEMWTAFKTSGLSMADN